MYRTVPVADGVYAFISPETTGPIPSGNVVAIVGEDGVLVVDSGLKALMAMDATTIVPGHGEVMHDWAYAKKVTAALEALRAQATEAVRQGASLEDTRKRVQLESFQKEFAGSDFGRGKAFRDFFVFSAVERAYQEAKGTMAPE